jgi:hypothetical protein
MWVGWVGGSVVVVEGVGITWVYVVVRFWLLLTHTDTEAY